MGLNYSDHAKETGAEVPKEPVLFMKAANTMVGPNDDVLIPRRSTKTDWEVELGVVIGTEARYLESREHAESHIAGYCISHDVSEREFQLERGGQWSKGKSCDTFNPLGPWVATREEVADVSNLSMRLSVNGQIRQRGNTGVIDREDDRPLGRGEIEPDHVADLRLERRVGAPLERLGPMRLEARGGPDPLNRRDADAGSGRHPASAPVGCPVGRWLQRQGDHPVAGRPVVGRLVARAGRVAQAGQPPGLEAPPPEQDRHRAHRQLVGDRAVRDGHRQPAARSEPEVAIRCSVRARTRRSRTARSDGLTTNWGAGGWAMRRIVAAGATMV